MADEKDFDILPVVDFKAEILDAVKQNQIIICIGETGSGKTTQIPQFLADCFISSKDDNASAGSSSGIIGITQPRRIAAISVAQRVSSERSCSIGGFVGYSVRFDDQTSQQTRIKYMTDGILVRECLQDRSLSRYSVIMLDEAHERSLNTDILFGLLKQACRRRPELRLVVTSATLDTEKFCPYFGNCPVIRVPGRTFPVDIYHSKTRQVMTASGPASSSAYVQAAVDVVLKIHRSQADGHVLVFLTGQEEIERACGLLRAALAAEKEELGTGAGTGANRELIVLPLYAALSNEKQSRVFKKPSMLLESDSERLVGTSRGAGTQQGKQEDYRLLRKCVIATNIAETSITVPQVRFVVDAGYVKQKAFDPQRGIEALIVVPVSKVAALQRAGRAGRTAPGQCYRLYSSDCFDNFPDETVPEIKRVGLASTVLYLKAMGIHDVLGFDFLDPPSQDQLLQALELLHALRGLDDTGRITALGRQMSAFPLEPRLSRALLAATTPECDCLEEVATVCAMLSAGADAVWAVPHRPKQQQMAGKPPAASSGPHHQEQQQQQQQPPSRLQLRPHATHAHCSQLQQGASETGNGTAADAAVRAAELAHSALRHPYGDPFSYLNVFLAWQRAGGGSVQWCERNFISFRMLKTAKQIKEQLHRDAQQVAAAAVPQEDRDRGRHLDCDVKFEKNGSERKARAPRDRAGGGGGNKKLEQRVSSALTYGFFVNAAVQCANESVYKCLLPPSISQQPSNSRSSATSGSSSSSGSSSAARMVHIHPSSALAYTKPPEYVVYQELLSSNRLYIKQVAKADRKLLLRLQAEWKPLPDVAQLSGRHREAVQLPSSFSSEQHGAVVDRTHDDENGESGGRACFEVPGSSRKRRHESIDQGGESDFYQIDEQGQDRQGHAVAAEVKEAAHQAAERLDAAVALAKQRFLARKQQQRR